jgi:hypothetical protein
LPQFGQAASCLDVDLVAIQPVHPGWIVFGIAVRERLVDLVEGSHSSLRIAESGVRPGHAFEEESPRRSGRTRLGTVVRGRSQQDGVTRIADVRHLVRQRRQQVRGERLVVGRMSG